jgi:hypothetical protein
LFRFSSIMEARPPPNVKMKLHRVIVTDGLSNVGFGQTE